MANMEYLSVEWDELRTRSGTVAFVPELDDERDTSYFVAAGQRSPTRLSQVDDESNPKVSEMQSECRDSSEIEVQSSDGSPDLVTSPKRRGRAGFARSGGEPWVSRRSSADEEGEDDFLNFSFNNLPSLLQRDLELLRSETAGAPAAGAENEMPIN